MKGNAHKEASKKAEVSKMDLCSISQTAQKRKPVALGGQFTPVTDKIRKGRSFPVVDNYFVKKLKGLGTCPLLEQFDRFYIYE